MGQAYRQTRHSRQALVRESLVRGHPEGTARGSALLRRCDLRRAHMGTRASQDTALTAILMPYAQALFLFSHTRGRLIASTLEITPSSKRSTAESTSNSTYYDDGCQCFQVTARSSKRSA